MTKMNKTSATKMVNDLIAAGKSYTAIRTVITTLGYEKADDLLKELGVEKGKKISIIDEMYKYLEEAPRTEAEFKEWVATNGTENTMRWFKQHNKARELANKIHAKYSK